MIMSERWYFLLEGPNFSIEIKSIDKGVVLSYNLIMLYPPKICLRGGKAFDYALCEQTHAQPLSQLCGICSFINCNKDILSSLLSTTYVKSYKIFDESGNAAEYLGAINTFINHFFI